MKKLFSLALALTIMAASSAALLVPQKADALSIDISKDQGNSGGSASSANNGNPAQQNKTVYTKLESVYYRNGVVNFNYAITNFFNWPVTVNNIRYDGVLSLNGNYYNFGSNGVVSNCYINPNQTARITLSFKENRFGNYVGNVGSNGKTNTNWTNHK